MIQHFLNTKILKYHCIWFRFKVAVRISKDDGILRELPRRHIEKFHVIEASTIQQVNSNEQITAYVDLIP